MPDHITYERTRIAPTPSGFLHLGNVFSFALTVGLARQFGAKVLLRIDDLDRQRSLPVYVQDIFDTLQFMEIPWDEGPKSYKEYEQEYAQVHRLPLYRAALQQLKHSGKLFACHCSRSKIARISTGGAYPGTCLDKDLPLLGAGCNWRLNTDDATQIAVTDLWGKCRNETLTDSMRHFIVRKKDGLPAYQLASVVDDVHFGVDMVVRGSDLWESTLAQLYLGRMLEADTFSRSVFFHHCLLCSNMGDKLSKSAGSTSVKYLREQGKTAKAIYGMIGQLAGHAETVTDWEGLVFALPKS